MLYINSGTISSVSIVLGKSCAVPFFQTYLFMLIVKFYECVQCGSRPNPNDQRTLKGGAWEAARKALGSKLKEYISEDSHMYHILEIFHKLRDTRFSRTIMSR